MPRVRHVLADRTTRARAAIALAIACMFVESASAALGKVSAGADMRTGGVSAQGDNSSGYNSQQGPAYAPLFFNECVISNVNEACLTSDSKWLNLQPNHEATGFKLDSSLSVSKPVVEGFAASQESITISLVVSDLASFEVASFRFVGSMSGSVAGAVISLTGPGVNLRYDGSNPSWNTCFQVVDGEYVLSISTSIQLSGQETGSKALNYALTLDTDFCPSAPMSGQIIDPSSGHLYSLLSPETWKGSHDLAVALGGQLATIDNGQENEWVRDTVANGIPGLSGRDLWIGINDVATEGAFAWSSGERVGFLNWAAGEPDDIGDGGAGADFGQLSAETGLWSDATDTTARFSVAEFEIPSCGSAAGSCFAVHGPGCDGESCCHTVCYTDGFCCATSWDSDCVEEAKALCDPGVVAGPFFNPTSGHHYYLLESGAWSEAQKRALFLNGALATIDDAAENEWVRINVASFDGMVRSCFVGLSDQAVAGVFQWLDHSVAEYTNWGAGEPRNPGGSAHFARLDGDEGTWSAHDNGGGADSRTFAVVEVSCIGDLDGDGNVDSGDIGLLLAAWNSRSGSADLNRDGIVDGADLGLLLGSWNACGAASVR